MAEIVHFPGARIAERPQPLSDGENLALANFLLALKSPVEFEGEYRNWRGDVATRRLRVIAFWYGSTEWHPKSALMLQAIDLDKNAERDFCVADFNLLTLRPVGGA